MGTVYGLWLMAYSGNFAILDILELLDILEGIENQNLYPEYPEHPANPATTTSFMALFNGLQIIRIHSWLTNNAVLYCLVALSQPPNQQYGYRLARKTQRNHEQNPVKEHETGIGRAPSSAHAGFSLPPSFL